RYVFACPGEAIVLAQAATGVCYFNMRVVRSNGDSVVQRSYNATVVRVIRLDASGGGFSLEPPRTPAASPGNAAHAEDDPAVGSGITDSGTEVMTKEGKVRVVPAVEPREGSLCVEMRIRFYKDGAMSKLLDR
ncbi:unnamed protein product, partial [Ascophyllum nodosum]